MTELRASLRNSAGSTTWDMPPNAGENIPGGIFNKVVVSQGKWIFYNNDYNLNDGRSVVVDEGEGEIDLGFFCESAREIKHAADGIALFEHYKYRGVTKTYTDSAATLSGFNSGISAGVIFPAADWNLYSAEHFKGLKSKQGPGDYPTPQDLGVGNDTVKSIRRI